MTSEEYQKGVNRAKEAFILSMETIQRADQKQLRIYGFTTKLEGYENTIKVYQMEIKALDKELTENLKRSQS